MWEYAKEIHQYLPDSTPKQLPERDYLFAILSTLCVDSLDSLVSEALKKRSLNENTKLGDFVKITKAFKKEIEKVFMHLNKNRYY